MMRYPWDFPFSAPKAYVGFINGLVQGTVLAVLFLAAQAITN